MVHHFYMAITFWLSIITRPESTLKKKNHSICYHSIRESVAMGESLAAHVRSENNPSDIASKLMSGGKKRDGLVSTLLYDFGELQPKQ